jgi:hypothetical protein
MRRTAIAGLAWRHRHRLWRWTRFVGRSVRRALARDVATLPAELRLVALLDGDERFADARVRVSGQTARFGGLVRSAQDVDELERMADQLGLRSSLDGLRVRRRVWSRPADGGTS